MLPILADSRIFCLRLRAERKRSVLRREVGSGRSWENMQIDRRPNRGPYVAALVCLLTLCLTIPLYWQSRHRARQASAPRWNTTR